MILKTLTHDRGESGCWNYYSNVESASVFIDDTSKNRCVAVRFKDAKEEVIVVLTNDAYLCNDRGETIERLYGKPKMQKHDKYPYGK